MPVPQNISVGTLFLKTLPELPCFSSMEEFLVALPDIYGLSIPDSITNVIVSNVQPNSDQTAALWVRLSNSGNFMGIYVFSGGNWVQIVPTPNAIQWMYGDSASPPPGYANTDDAGTTYVSNALKASLKALWLAGDKTPPSYEYYSAVWIGF